MTIHDDLAGLSLPQSLLTIGSFDGLHLGHQALLQDLIAEARRSDLPSVVVTFYPHPSVVLRGRRPSFYITLPEDKASRLEMLGIDHVVTQRFDEDLSRVTAGAFLDRLMANLHFRGLWIGEDFALGHEREGNRLFLRREAELRGFALHEVPPVKVGGEVVSSTRVREALRSGDVARVATYLGRPFMLRGPVIRGAARGQRLGIPTANMALRQEQAYPREGVYACWADLPDGRRQAVVNVGFRPTFADGLPAPVVEAHILDWQGDLYEYLIGLAFVARLRDEQRFPSKEALVEQIRRDIDRTRGLLGAAMGDDSSPAGRLGLGGTNRRADPGSSSGQAEGGERHAD
ncbi:MAG TPA: riboflavin biosynthesis protein RibF [Anaerolineales bacterium]|nr:riboflavin biosynthesis protein RibF [Anaerolineales bacterium]